ncbi:MAG: deoxyribodipyrimidine photo-lyase [Campylobacterales bacterium]|nr:deoxyribodipyrimidine photo-lyase [Campylobacterales bacterium]
MKSKLNIVIFRNNLRTKDNIPLFKASLQDAPVLGLYSFEILLQNKFQNSFVYQSLQNLKQNLKALDINLICTNSFQNTLDDLSTKFDIKVFYEKEVGTYEKQLEMVFQKYNHEQYFNQTMIEPFSFDYTKSFSHFRKKAQKLSVSKPFGDPKTSTTIKYESLSIPNSCETIFKGGEDEANKRVEYYMQFIHQYKSTRDKVDGLDNSTKFSPYLSIGCISARQIYHKLKEQEAKTYESKSSYWIYFELLWRDFFYLLLDQSGSKLFKIKGLKDIEYRYIAQINQNYKNFFEGYTKVDLIDASIKELTTTGWLSNRNRQLVASYGIKNLGISWLDIAKFFQTYLIDYNPASNYGNMAYQGYVGNDSSYRVFDIYKQSELYGGKTYVKKWLEIDEDFSKVDIYSQANSIKNSVYNII